MTRQILAVFLSVILVVTSGAMTAARGDAQSGTLMVICTGSGFTAVVLDENGEPVETRQVCPDCALGALAGLPPGLFTLAPVLPVGKAFVDAGHPAQTSEFTGPVLPRGPPSA